MKTMTPASAWTEVLTPPKPYLYALRRSFPNDLHVLVLTQEAGGKLQVLSSVDHGTSRGTVTHEGESADPSEIADLIAQTCERWNPTEPTGIAAMRRHQRRYYYSTPSGGISGEVSRTDLFELVDKGVITWDSQIWEDIESMADSGRWRPIIASLGFPQKHDML